MTLKEAQEQYPDAIQVDLKAAPEVMKMHNLYNQNELRIYLQGIFPGQSVLDQQINGSSIKATISFEAFEEEKRELSMIPGTKVIMTGAEGEFPEYKNKIWEVYAGPQWMCGEFVVWLTGFSGAYSCKYLQIVES